MEKREPLVVFSPFQAFSTTLAGILKGAGVPCALLDGRTPPEQRGILAEEFKLGRFPVLIAGVESMGEGHSFECASNLVLPSLSWAYDKNTQAIDRVHRLVSTRPVTIYLMVTRGTIDERLLSLFQEKGDSADLALDGRLFQAAKDEVNLAELLRDCVEHFDPSTPTIDESSVATQAALTLIPRLSSAAAAWRPPTPAAPARTTPSLRLNLNLLSHAFA